MILYIYMVFYEFSMEFDLGAHFNLKMSEVDISMAYPHFKRWRTEFEDIQGYKEHM